VFLVVPLPCKLTCVFSAYSFSHSSTSSIMSQSHSQDENDASKSNSTDALKANNQDRDNTQASRDNDRVPSPTPPSAQPGQAPSNQPLLAPKATNPSDQPSPQHPSPSVPACSQKPDEVPRNPDSSKAMSNGQNGQISGNQSRPSPQGPEPDLGGSKDALEAYDWDELEERFHAEMGKCEEVEKGIQSEFDDLLEVYRVLHYQLLSNLQSCGQLEYCRTWCI
jgi:hypothetical protein